MEVFSLIYSVYDTIVNDIAMSAALTRSASATGSAIMSDNHMIDCTDSNSLTTRSGDTVSYNRGQVNIAWD